MQAVATATYQDAYAGPVAVHLIPQRTTRRGERATVYRWQEVERGFVVDGLRCGFGPARMMAHARQHRLFSNVQSLEG